MKILILGHTGMLGHMVKAYLGQNHVIETTGDRWPTQEFKDAVSKSDADYLINCIGAIPQRTKEFDVNFELPVWLDSNFQGRVIHPGTDCEMDVDDYGISKARAADWIKKSGQRTKIIKTSIIGPELKGSSSLLCWFLSNEDGSTVRGYTNHLWNGNTTYYWAKISEDLINDWDNFSTETVVSSSVSVSKYTMLNIFNDVYDRGIFVVPFSAPTPADKRLTGHVELPDIKTQLEHMVEFYSNLSSE